MSADFDFAQLVYQLVVVEKQKNLSEVATELDLTYATMHARLNRRVHFRPAEIRKLIKLLGDTRLVMHFLEETPFVVAERADADTNVRDVLSLTHRNLFQIVEILRQVRDAVDDGQIDHRERMKLLDEIEEAEIALASLKAAVNTST
jgi:hypothetical protein